MELDEDDYEALGFVKADVANPQKFNKKLSALGLILTSDVWVHQTLGKEKKQSWRLRFPERYKEINKRYRKSTKGKATVKEYRKKYLKTPKAKTGQAKRQQKHYQKIKNDPVKYATYLKQKAALIKKRRAIKRGITTTTNKNNP